MQSNKPEPILLFMLFGFIEGLTHLYVTYDLLRENQTILYLVDLSTFRKNGRQFILPGLQIFLQLYNVLSLLSPAHKSSCYSIVKWFGRPRWNKETTILLCHCHLVFTFYNAPNVSSPKMELIW